MPQVTMTSSGMADLVHVASSRGATYADARTVEREHETVSVKDGAVESVTRTADRGLALRVIHRGAWGFAATDRVDDSASASSWTRRSAAPKHPPRCSGGRWSSRRSRPNAAN